MAKVAFSKLKCKVNDAEMPIQIGEETIMIKQYLPIQEKLALVGRVVELAHDETYNFNNPMKTEILMKLELVYAYSNINFTDKQKEDIPKLYDLLVSTGVLATLLEAIPLTEYQAIEQGVQNTITAVYAYQHSFVGMLDTLKNNYADLDLNVNDLLEKIKNSDNDLDLIKGMLTKLN